MPWSISNHYTMRQTWHDMTLMFKNKLTKSWRLSTAPAMNMCENMVRSTSWGSSWHGIIFSPPFCPSSASLHCCKWLGLPWVAIGIHGNFKFSVTNVSRVVRNAWFLTSSSPPMLRVSVLKLRNRLSFINPRHEYYNICKWFGSHVGPLRLNCSADLDGVPVDGCVSILQRKWNLGGFTGNKNINKDPFSHLCLNPILLHALHVLIHADLQGLIPWSPVTWATQVERSLESSYLLWR